MRRRAGGGQPLSNEYPKRRNQRRLDYDCDYFHKLSKKDKAWLWRFRREWMLAMFGQKPLHKSIAIRKEIQRDVKKAQADVFSQPSDAIDAEIHKESRAANRGTRYYTPHDYNDNALTAKQIEAELIDSIVIEDDYD